MLIADTSPRLKRQKVQHGLPSVASLSRFFCLSVVKAINIFEIACYFFVGFFVACFATVLHTVIIASFIPLVVSFVVTAV